MGGEELSLISRMVAASCGATLTALVVTPMDVVKTRLQLASEGVASSGGVGELVKCPSCGVFVLNNGLMEHTLSKTEFGTIFGGGGGGGGVCGTPCAHPEPAAASAAAARSAGRLEVAESLSLLGRIARAEGAAGLYAGLGPTLAMAVPNTVLYFTAYDELRSRWAASLGPSAPGFAGASARALAASAVAPFELVRTQLQALQGSERGAYAAALRRTVAADGYGALWRGLGSTLWRDVPFSACYWVAYERLRGALRRSSRRGPRTASPSPSSRAGAADTLAAAGLAGLGAGAFSALLTTPFDVVKTRMMVDAHLQRDSGLHTFAYLGHIARTEGPRAVMSGAAPRLFKVAPACAIMIGTYEYAKALFGTEPPA